MKELKKTLIAASVLGADLSSLKEAVRLCESSGIDMLHLDIMDGHFVPDITFGNKFVADIRKITELPLDVHLMVNNPAKFLDSYIDAGADSLSFHIEADIHVHRSLEYIKSRGVKAGICLVPSTPVDFLSEIISDVDYVQVMTVNPGFSGQKMIQSCVNKIRQLDVIRREKNLDFTIFVDGGVNPETSGKLIEYGADILITASAFFNSDNPAVIAEKIRKSSDFRAVSK